MVAVLNVYSGLLAAQAIRPRSMVTLVLAPSLRTQPQVELPRIMTGKREREREEGTAALIMSYNYKHRTNQYPVLFGTNFIFPIFLTVSPPVAA